tara:strand:+ start:6424 stop:6666 length:243 start_codon:yes stop_codon:yes gene_type:complete
MTLEYGSNPKKAKKKFTPKLSTKEVTKHIKLLSGGLSFGGGVLGCVYLLNLGIPMIGVGIFGIGVVIVHIAYLKTEADKY